MTSARGFTVVEALGALALGSIVLSVLVVLLQPPLDLTVRTPEHADLLERARAAESILRESLESTGAGADLLGQSSITDVAPGIWPRRLGRWSADPDTSAWPDRFTVVTVPWLAPQAPLAAAIDAGDVSLDLAAHQACGSDASCGFRAGDLVAVMEAVAGVEFASLAGTAPVRLDLDVPVSSATPSPAVVAAIDMRVFYFDAARRQLRRYDGVANDQPVLDDVVSMAVRYYADPAPPARPAVDGVATCAVGADGVALLPLLGPLPGPLVEMTTGELADGPWCGHAPWQFDADLLRLRAVRIRLRLQASSSAVRGMGPAFQHPGQATRRATEVRDVELDVFVAPRALRGG